MKRARNHGLVAAATAVAAALAASGCGSSSSVDPVAQAADTTAAMPGADLSFSAAIQAPGLTHPVSFNGTGTEDGASKSVDLKIDFSQLAALSKGALPAGTQLEERTVYPNIYMRAPFLTKQLPGAKTWLKINIATAAKQQGIDISSFTQTDPTGYLQNLRATTGGVQKVGTETVRGVTTTHYKATIDLNKLPKLAPASQRATAQHTAQRLIQLTGRSSYPTEVWIDGQRRVRRIRVALGFKTTGSAAQPASLSETIEFFNFGPKPPIAAPPADQVTDLSKLAAGLSTGSGTATKP